MAQQIWITEVEFLPIRPRDGLLGFASFLINDSIRVNGVGVHSRLSGEGIRLVYPEKTLPNGTRIALFLPVNRDADVLMERSVEERISYIYKKRTINLPK